MIRKFCITLFLLLFFTIRAEAKIDIVHPSSNNGVINAPSTYITGSTNQNAVLTINSKKVKIWNGGIFVFNVPLEYGTNKIKIKSTHSGIHESRTLFIKRNKPAVKSPVKMPVYKQNTVGVLYAKTINDLSTVREKPSSSSQRVIDLPANIVLYLEGQQGDYYKIQEKGNSEFWIHKSNLTVPVSLGKRITPQIKNIKFYTDKKYEYYKFYLTYPVLYTLKQQGNSINVTMYGVKDDKGSNNYTYTLNFDKPILGYDCYYENSSLVFRKAKHPDFINISSPLQGIKIYVDAGHGGSEKGAIAPDRICEKNINLDIACNLIKLLKEAGADVTYSRITDKKVELYNRVKMAKANNALISISIHNNSLSYGEDPYLNHGTEVHYYNDNAKELANIIKNNLVKDLNIKDNGIHKSSFAMTRETNPVSILVEIAYMQYPEEYLKLKNPQFRKEAAKSIKKSLEQYILTLK